MKSFLGGATIALLIAAPAMAQQANLGISGSISGAGAPASASSSLSIGSGVHAPISQASLAANDLPAAPAPARTVDLSGSTVPANDTMVDRAREQPAQTKPAQVQGPRLDARPGD